MSRRPSSAAPQTGPTTPSGKAVSSANAATHGGTSRKLFVAGEDPAAFDALRASLIAEHAPASGPALHLVDDFALAQWLLWRRIRACNSVEHALYEAQPDPALWPDSAFQRLATVERYRTTAERAFQRALGNLQHIRYAQDSLANRTLRQRNFESRLALDRERFALQKQRLELTRQRDGQVIADKQDAAYSKACGTYPLPTVVQKIRVRKADDGATITEIDPPNGIVRTALDRGQFPIDQVCRKFLFLDGMPPEYWWDAECKRHARVHKHTMEQFLTRDVWLEMADEEERRGDGHAVSGFAPGR